MPTFPRFAAALLAFGLLAAACGDDSATDAGPGTIDLGENGLTPSQDDVQVDSDALSDDSVSDDSVIGLEFATFEGDTARFDDHLGQPLVINFFAEWCPNCIAEMPDFEEVFQDFDGEVAFVGMSIDQASESALRLVEETGVTYETGWDPSEEIYAHFRALAMPTTVFVNPDGSIERVWSGALDADGLTDLINEEIL